MQCVAMQSLLSLGCNDDLDLRLLSTGINFPPLYMPPTVADAKEMMLNRGI